MLINYIQIILKCCVCFYVLQNATDLEVKYNEVTDKLDKKYTETQAAKLRAQDLRERARKLFQETYEKLANLRSKIFGFVS